MKILLNQMTVFRKGTTQKLSVLVEDGRIVSLSPQVPQVDDALVIELKNGTLLSMFISASRVFHAKRPSPPGPGRQPTEGLPRSAPCPT